MAAAAAADDLASKLVNGTSGSDQSDADDARTASATSLGQDEAAAAPPALQRVESSGQLTFDHVFLRENAGKLEDHYDVKERKGEGTFGSVFRAKCKQTGVERAVKAIEIKNVKNPARFDREIEIKKVLDHPNVVRLYETFRDAKKIYLVMELCTGGELFDRIVDEGTSGFNELKAAKYIRQILAALCYLHAHKFAHRDVKPENFLLHNNSQDSALKIIDFGLAMRFEPGQLMSTKAGTAYYVAPEVLKGGYTEKCDIWSAGVISFILLCGYPPFAGDTDPEILRKVKEGSFEFKSPDWDNISQGAKNLVTQMLTVDPALRPSAEVLLTSPWLKFKGAIETVALKSDFLTRLQSFNAQSRLKKVALAAVAQQLPDEDIQALQQTFRALDTNGDGLLSPEEIREGLAQQGLQVPQELQDILKSVDLTGSGQMDYTEFVAASMDKKLFMKRDICWQAFRVFDLDGDGKITKDELGKVLSGDKLRGAFDAGKLGRIISEADKDGDGCVDFEEFVAMMMPDQPPQKKRRTGGA
mmetsp:Transcript_142627/g.246878  ORF Transcript_142627/g.246878 Transcript_142627/m.246878 type:complete len:529 (+) Transcript_142627:106-1692(+)